MKILLSRVFSYVLSKALETKGYLEIYDFMGNLVELHQVLAGQTEINLNLSSEVGGVYMVNLISGEFVWSHEKIIIQK